MTAGDIKQSSSVLAPKVDGCSTMILYVLTSNPETIRHFRVGIEI
jgi:hypothetical protein